jgi:hypothetical protein
MAKTEKLGLNLTEDESTSFSDWRKSIDGNNPSGSKSNMQLIDEKVGGHETRITALESRGGLYVHTVDVGGPFVVIVSNESKPYSTLQEFASAVMNAKEPMYDEIGAMIGFAHRISVRSDYNANMVGVGATYPQNGSMTLYFKYISNDGVLTDATWETSSARDTVTAL